MDDEIKDTEEETDETPPANKTPEKKDNEEETDDEAKKRSSAVFQKKVWRERASKAEKAVEDLRAELEKLKGLVAKPTNEQEQKAQDYIREQARRVFEELKDAQKRTETQAVQELETKLDEVLEDNPDITKEELLDIVEELEVEPKTALKILKRQEKVKEKPKMPSPKKGSPNSPKEKPDDTKKNMWQIAQDEISKVLNKE